MRHRARARSAVVVAVRGTSSVEDVITDSVAEPERLEPEWLPEGAAAAGAGAMFAHGGIKAAAESILAVRPPMAGPAHMRAPHGAAGSPLMAQPADAAARMRATRLACAASLDLLGFAAKVAVCIPAAARRWTGSAARRAPQRAMGAAGS